jgi:hypothetical protein
MPKNPKLMFQICQKLNRGLCMKGDNQTVSLRRNTAPIHHSPPLEASPFAGGTINLIRPRTRKFRLRFHPLLTKPKLR